MRLFIAIDLSDSMKKSVVPAMHALKAEGLAGNYVPIQNLHVTLAFLGEVQDTRPVREAMDSLKAGKARVVFSGYEFFGSTLVLTVKGNQKLKIMVQSLRKALKEKGIAFDEQEFKPHVTLVRRAKGRKVTAAVPQQDMTATKISLMKSELRPGKSPVYKEIYSTDLE